MGRMIAVPMNEQGIKDYINDMSKTENLRYFEFPDEEFMLFFKSGLLEQINLAFGLMIDDCEEEIIGSGILLPVKGLVQPYKDKLPVFWEALEYAVLCGTEMCLEF